MNYHNLKSIILGRTRTLESWLFVKLKNKKKLLGQITDVTGHSAHMWTDTEQEQHYQLCKT